MGPGITRRLLLLVLLFAALVALEVATGQRRMGALAEARERESLEQIARAQADLVAGLGPVFEEQRRHAAFLARTDEVARFLTAPDEREPREYLQRKLFHYLISFPAIDRVRVLDSKGIERLRCERIGGAVGAIPVALLNQAAERELLQRARALPAGEVDLSELEVDQERVEVPRNERQVLHLTAAVTDDSGLQGLLILTVYASPLLSAARGFEPWDGVRSYLVDGEGAFLAHPERDRERGGARPGVLGDVLGPRAAEVLEGSGRLALDGEHILYHSLSETADWRIVTRVPNSVLRDLARPGVELWWSAGSILAVSLTLAAAGILIARLWLSELRLREAQSRALEQREMERRLALNERMASLGQLTAGVAHEINNPLEGIGNYLSLLEKNHLPLEKRARYIELVRHGFNRIRDIVRDLSIFSRQSPGSVAADISLSAGRALDLVQGRSGFEAIEIEATGLDERQMVQGDGGQLEQVVLNLLINAGQALGPAGGQIWVCLKATGPIVELTVEDDGPGIAAEDLSRLFDPFFSKRGGTGLGLAISYGIVRASGGELEAINRSEGGARFSMRLPKHASQDVVNE